MNEKIVIYSVRSTQTIFVREVQKCAGWGLKDFGMGEFRSSGGGATPSWGGRGPPALTPKTTLSLSKRMKGRRAGERKSSVQCRLGHSRAYCRTSLLSVNLPYQVTTKHSTLGLCSSYTWACSIWQISRFFSRNRLVTGVVRQIIPYWLDYSGQ